MKAQSAVRAIGQAVAREHSVPVRRASKPRLLDLHRTAGNAAVTALVRGAGARAQAVALGSGPIELGDALAATFGESVRKVPVEAESAVARRAEGVTVDGRVQLAPGRLDATSYEGQVRIGHEVAHALQQARGVNSASGRLPVTQAGRAALEAEAERAGHALAGGRPFAVSGVAPAGTALFRGAEGQEPEAEQELDAAITQLDAKWAAQDAAIAATRKEREDWLRAHAEWREIEVPVDDSLRKTPAELQPHELDVRVLETALGSISRDDAEYLLRRLAWTSWPAEEASVPEQIRTRAKIQYRARGISLAVEYYNQLIEDRQRRWAYVEELLHTGPDMGLEMLKDVGRGVYNGALGFGQGVADLPLAPLNLARTIQGKDPVHTFDLGGLRAGYHTWYGFHQGSSIELGTQLGLMAVTGKLPGSAAAGSGAAATQTSRAAGLFSAWWRMNGLAAGGTAVVQAGQGIRDIERGYVVENGKQRPLTEDDILQRLAGIAFGAHAAYHAVGGRAAQPSTAAGAEPPAGLVEPPEAPDVAGRTADVSPLELPGEEVVIEGSAPESHPPAAAKPAVPGPQPAAPDPRPAAPEPPAAAAMPAEPQPAAPEPSATMPAPAVPRPAEPAPAGSQPPAAGLQPEQPGPPVTETGPAEPAPAPRAPAESVPAEAGGRQKGGTDAEPGTSGTAADQQEAALRAERMSRIQESEAEAAALRGVRQQLSELNKAARQSNDRVEGLDRELRRTPDRTQRTELNRRRDAALRDRRRASDELRDFREKHEIEKDADLDYQISELESEIAGLRDELNPRPVVTVDESQPLGGRWYDIPTQGGEVHHMPAQDANPYLSSGKGPSIRMEKADHQLTNSWGRRNAAASWRADQAALIAQGKFTEALAMDIADVRAKFGAKYERGIQQMLDYVEKSPDIAALNKNSALKASDLRTPPAVAR